jgi:predicted ATPase
MNRKPIIETDITVKELTIIVGMNNTGKSLFAHAIHALYNEDLNYSIFIDFFKTNPYMINLYNNFIKRRTSEYIFTREELLKISVLITEYFGSPEVAKQIYNFIFYIT